MQEINSASMYLRPDVQIDPLIHGWYAWVQIIPPAPAAFNVLERQIKAMKSFVVSPELHAAALKNPAMRGGPFIDLPSSEVAAVQQLLQKMAGRTRRQAEFVEAVRALDALLEARAEGWSLETLYPEIPEALRGYVELVYDRHHRPDFRLFEPLLYGSPLYDERAQSVALARFRGDRARPFVFSTPRVRTEGGLDLQLPFRSQALDALFVTRAAPCKLAKLEDMLGIEPDSLTVFRSLFTEEVPERRAAYELAQPRLRYFGHACVLIEASGVSILVDPLIPYPDIDCESARFTYADLPEHIDYVLITHGHHDHIVLETLLQLRHKIGTIVVGKNAEGNILDPSLKLMLKHLGFSNVMEVGEFDEINIGIGAITALPFLGEHHDLHVYSKLCYHVRLGQHTVLFAADSCNFGHGVYERCLGHVDVLFIGMECDGAPVSWVYGPTFTKKPDRDKDHSRRGRGSDSDEALALVEYLKCSQVYVYAMGSEPWVQHILDVHYTEDSNAIVHSNRFARECQEKGVKAERLHGAKEILLS